MNLKKDVQDTGPHFLPFWEEEALSSLQKDNVYMYLWE